MSQTEAFCEPLRTILKNAPRCCGRVLVSEMDFYLATAQIKRALGEALRGDIEAPRPLIFDRVDDLERCVETSTTRCFGTVYVSHQALKHHLAKLEANLGQYKAPPLAWRELSQLIETSRLVFGRLALNEEKFYEATTRFKKSFLPELPLPQPLPPWFTAIDAQLSEFEELLWKSPTKLLGRVSMRPQEYEARVEALSASLRAAQPVLPGP